MKDYFAHVVNGLNIDDLNILGILFDRDASSAFKALRNAEILEASKMSETTYRRTVYRLEANRLIEVTTLQKKHVLYITEFGISAIERSLKGVGA